MRGIGCSKVGKITTFSLKGAWPCPSVLHAAHSFLLCSLPLTHPLVGGSKSIMFVSIWFSCFVRVGSLSRSFVKRPPSNFEGITVKSHWICQIGSKVHILLQVHSLRESPRNFVFMIVFCPVLDITQICQMMKTGRDKGRNKSNSDEVIELLARPARPILFQPGVRLFIEHVWMLLLQERCFLLDR